MNTEEHLLTVFAEELNEVAKEILILQQTVLKAMRFGLEAGRTVELTNREEIQNEWQDLLGSIQKLREVGVDLKPDLKQIYAKMEKIETYCGYAEQLGTLIR